MKSDIKPILMPILSEPQFSSHRLLMWAHIIRLSNRFIFEIITWKECLIYYMRLYLTISHNNFKFSEKTEKLLVLFLFRKSIKNWKTCHTFLEFKIFEP